MLLVSRVNLLIGEHTRKNLDVLLTTPLSGRRIVKEKFRCCRGSGSSSRYQFHPRSHPAAVMGVAGLLIHLCLLRLAHHPSVKHADKYLGRSKVTLQQSGHRL